MIRYIRTFPLYVYMIVILKFLLLGVVTGELIYILFSGFGFVTDYTGYDRLFFYVQLFIIALMVLALFMPGNLAKICGMFFGRWDLTLYFLLGTTISVSFQGFHVTEFLYHLTSFQYALIELGFFIPFVVREYYQVKKGRTSDQRVPHSSFLDDAALYDGADLLQYGPLAEDFANKIYDNKSPNSMIWGVEGPWGIGKSSFLNLCEESLRKNHPREVTVIRFNALKYSGQYKDISIPLSDTLRETVYKTLKCPELDILLAQYQRIVKGISFNVLGISMNFTPFPRNESKVFTYISEILRNSNKKFIFAIDDLDRLNGEEVYSLLYSIKEIFDIPFINYVLCYDLDNLSKEMGTDKTAQKNVEFLEKFVQTKISLFTRKDVILRVLDEDIKVLMKDADLDVEANKKALKGVRNILTSDDAAEYIPFFGDLRKVKRYVNTLTALDIQRVDFPDFDFDERQLTELILLYMYCPIVFRKIYMMESWGWSREYYSSHYSYSERKNVPGYKVKSEICNMRKQYPNAAYLIKRLFDVEESSVTKINVSNRALLEVKDKRELMVYMDLIVNRIKRSKYEQSNFYINRIQNYLNGKLVIGDLFDGLMYERYHENLWRTLAYNNFPNLSRDRIDEIVHCGLSKRMRYSYTGDNFNIGLRNKVLGYFLELFKYLDISKYENENKQFIIEKIFGSHGIIDIISQESRGILGIYDLLQFRLRCCYSRHVAPGMDSNIFVYGIIGSYKNPKFSVGSQIDVLEFTKEEMRVLSQKCFSIFKQRYIDKHINFMKEIQEFPPALLDGDQSLISQQVVDYSMVQEIKGGMTTFITYQIGNNSLGEMGVGCGYYDENGTDDGQDIRKAFTKYLLDDVFQDSYYWQSFLLILAKNDQSFRESGEIGCDRVTECMGEEQLKSWWLTKGKNMMKLNLKVANYKPQVNGISSQEILRMYSESFEERFKCNPAIADEAMGKAYNVKKSSVETGPLD